MPTWEECRHMQDGVARAAFVAPGFGFGLRGDRNGVITSVRAQPPQELYPYTAARNVDGFLWYRSGPWRPTTARMRTAMLDCALWVDRASTGWMRSSKGITST
jgi:hypothetical protein